MFKIFAGIAGFVASAFAVSPSSCSLLFEWDEPECPLSLLK